MEDVARREHAAMLMKGTSMLFWKVKVAGALLGQVQFWAAGLFHHSVSRCWENRHCGQQGRSQGRQGDQGCSFPELSLMLQWAGFDDGAVLESFLLL